MSFISPAPRVGPAYSGLVDELKALVNLSIPVVLAQVGLMTMGLVDTMMVGQPSKVLRPNSPRSQTMTRHEP